MSLNSTLPLSAAACVSSRRTSPGATLYCLPPARITAYIFILRCSTCRPRRQTHPATATRTTLVFVCLLFRSGPANSSEGPKTRSLTRNCNEAGEQGQNYRQTEVV